MPKVTDPLLLRQLNGPAAAQARKVVTDPILLSQLNGTAAPVGSTTAANDALRSSLPMPDAPNPQALANAQQPNLHFGMSSADTPNPLPALNAFGSEALSSIPVAGPMLKQALGGNQNDAEVAANPLAASAGRFAGSAIPYAVAAELPVINQVMGFAGPWLQKAIMTGISQYTLNTGDNLQHGQNPIQAAENAVAPTAMAVPLSMFGPGGKAASARSDAVDALQAQGIPLTAGQQRGSHGMMMTESQLGGSASTVFRDKQLSALTSVALKAAGVDAKAATPEVVDKALTNFGKKFNMLAGMSNIPYDPTLINGLSDPVARYYQNTGTSVPIFKEILDQAKNAAKANGGIVPGSAYQDITEKIAKAMKDNPGISGPLSDMKEAMDDAVGRGISGKQTQRAWQVTRQQYANFMRVTDAVNTAGQFAAQGLVTPEALSQAVRGASSKRQYARGVGDLNKLSRDAVIAMPRLPDSGTSSRLGAMASVTSGMAGVGNFAFNHNLPASLAIAAAPLGPMIAGRAMLSAPGRHLLANGSTIPSVVGRTVLPQLTAPLVQSLFPGAGG